MLVGMKLDELVANDRTYNEEVDISVGRMPLTEMLRNIAKVSKVNLSVKGAENIMVTCNFSRAKIRDLIFFLCQEYNLDIEVVGNIVSISPVPPEEPMPPDSKVTYEAQRMFLSYDLIGDRLVDVGKKITQVSGINLIIPPALYPRQVSGFVENMPFDDAVVTLASVNGLEIFKNRSDTWEIAAPPDNEGTQSQVPMSARRASNELEVDSLGYISAHIARGNVRDIIIELCERLGYNYFFVSPLDHQASIYLREVEFETLLGVLLAGTQYSYYRENGIYIFGTSTANNPGLFSVRVIPLHYRSVNTLEEVIPENLRSGLQIKQFPDLNSIIACGDQRSVTRVETFLRSIDRRVPLVTIEVIIVDVNKTNIQEAGISTGLNSSNQGPTSGTVTGTGGLSMTLNSSSVNNLLNSFSGFGSVKLGKVSSDFYMSLRFLEDEEFIEIRSTPKLSTLNGHEATLTSGEKRYYKEVTNTYMGTQNPVLTDSFVWKDVEANFSLSITPYVSEDEHITLDIEIEQTEFTTVTTSEDDGPPGTSTRSFKSQVRVQNEEMVLLGGIDRNERLKGSGGLPFIARIPVLKWIFGNSRNNKTDQQLSIFIKPTIID